MVHTNDSMLLIGPQPATDPSRTDGTPMYLPDLPSLPPFFLSQTEVPAKADTYARDRRALQ